MLLLLPDVLTGEELQRVRQGALQARYDTGKLTAGEGSRSRKNNLQISETDPSLPELRRIVNEALARNPLFQFLALPKQVMPLLFNCYKEGMYYHDHVDFALVGGAEKLRTDLSMTLFLSAAGEYDGGELVFELDDGPRSVKLDQGQAVIYPSGTVHRVNPVTRGARYAVVTTIQSFIRDDAKRQVLADVMRLARFVQDAAPQSEEARLANKLHANLLRMWADL
jgi:PKHD-type hydroxylase